MFLPTSSTRSIRTVRHLQCQTTQLSTEIPLWPKHLPVYSISSPAARLGIILIEACMSC